MRTTYLRGTKRRRDDQLITDRLKESDVSLGGKTMHIGVRNEAGSIYRSIEAQGSAQIIQVVQALYDLQFRDEMEHATTTKDGFDGIFSR